MELSDSDQDIHQKEDDAYAEDDLPDLGLFSRHQVWRNYKNTNLQKDLLSLIKQSCRYSISNLGLLIVIDCLFFFLFSFLKPQAL